MKIEIDAKCDFILKNRIEFNEVFKNLVKYVFVILRLWNAFFGFFLTVVFFGVLPLLIWIGSLLIIWKLTWTEIGWLEWLPLYLFLIFIFYKIWLLLADKFRGFSEIIDSILFFIENWFPLYSNKDKFKKFSYFPSLYKEVNSEIIFILQSNQQHKILEISEKILETIEKTEQMQILMKILLSKQYYRFLEDLIMHEIKFLDIVFDKIFSLQEQKYKKIIAKIDSIWQKSDNFSQVLELQKTRLHRQKEMFIKILQK